MKTCPQCGCASPADFKFCQSCGKDLAGLRAVGDTTVFSADLPGGFRAESRRTTSLDALFGKKNIVLLGRSPDADLWLSHPMVSRHHALLERLPDSRLRLTDLESVNGVYVNGQRLRGSIILDAMAAVGIGPFLFTSNAGQLRTIDSSQSLRLEGRQLEKVVKIGSGQTRKILDAVNLVVEPGEFVMPPRSFRLGQKHADGLPQRPSLGHGRTGARQRRGFLPLFSTTSGNRWAMFRRRTSSTPS